MATFEDQVDEAVKENRLPGVIFLARDSSGTLNYAKTAGRRSLQPEEDAPMKPDTVLRLASASKLLTTIACLQAVERGLIGLHEDVAMHVPVLAAQEILAGFTDVGEPLMKARTKPITLYSLLTHTAGSGYDFSPIQPLWRYKWWKQQPVGVGDCVEERFACPLLHEPGESWTYGGGASWAGKLLEIISGLTLEEWIREHICAPLGLTTVTFFPERHKEISARLSTISRRDASTNTVRYVAEDDPGPMSTTNCIGGECIYSSMEDLLAILHSLLVDDEKLLKRTTSAMMFTPQLTKVQKTAMQACLQEPVWICRSILKPKEYDWGIGGVLVDGNSHEYLQRGTLLWSGLLHVVWWIDRKAGVCGVFGAQLVPGTDKVLISFVKGFQREIYKQLHLKKLNADKGKAAGLWEGSALYQGFLPTWLVSLASQIIGPKHRNPS